ncbi:FAD-dependent monooxygenase [Nocardia sp. NPDC049707]|uniref:FAD-dependent oxidoreductase n=1 Tax=Nocardia sp. NPDC049707 TaxID=3154735 RepID=UPI003435710E
MVTIIGGGIAGTVLAGALARDGLPATVYERRSTVDAGAFLTLDARANAALGELGVDRADLDAASYEVRALGVHDLAGYRAQPGAGRRIYFRPDLLRVLTDFAHATSAAFHYDRPVTDLDIENGTLWLASELVTPDGPIIAADGIDSLVRAHLEPDRPAVYSGQVVIYGVTTTPITLPTEESVLHFHRTGNARPTDAFGHLWNDETAVWFARIRRPPIPMADNGFHPVDVWAEQIHTALPTIPELIDSLLAITDKVHVSNARDVPLTHPRPPRDDVILCGDADHAISPAAGVGARDAIEDAAALYRALVAERSIAETMATRRDQIRAERAEVAEAYRRGRF